MKGVKRSDWIAQYKSDEFEPGQAPSDVTIIRRLSRDEIPGVKQKRLGGRGHWYVYEDKPTGNALANKIIEKRINAA